MRANRRLAQLWLDALATELGAATGTIETYTDDLNCYLTWLEAQNLGLQGVTLEQLRDYIADLDQRGYAGSTVARRITVIRGLHRFLIAEDLGSNNPTATMPAMRRPRKLPPTCTRAALTCAFCRSCSAMPASRPPRSIPIWTPPACTRWSETSIH